LKGSKSHIFEARGARSPPVTEVRYVLTPHYIKTERGGICLMANEEHLKILKQGVDVWNKWRDINPDVIAYLVEAEIRADHWAIERLKEWRRERKELPGIDIQQMKREAELNRN